MASDIIERCKASA